MNMIVPYANNNALNGKLQTLGEMMLQLKNKAKDIRDEVANEELQGRKRGKGEVYLWMKQARKTEEEFLSIIGKVENASFLERGQLSSDIDRMMETVKQLLKQSDFPRGLVIDDFKPEGIQLVTEELAGSYPSTVQDQIWNCFVRDESRIGIYGMGGVGKTSVAMHINNKILTCRHVFNQVYYVTVSRDTNLSKLQGDIAKAFGIKLPKNDETRRAAELSMALKKRDKSLLILDDVWEDISMEKVGVATTGDDCKLLITTRDKKVCLKMNCNTAVEMKPLSEGEAWALFVKQLGNYAGLSEEVMQTARLVAKECDGLPLGIITMARCMRGVCDEHEWRTTLKELQNPSSSQHDMDNKVFNILQFSYDRLDDVKQKCFLCCTLYPEDYEIEWDELIRRFIAEGLVDGSSKQERIDKGNTLLNALKDASLLDCVILQGKKRVKVHDLLRDMAISIMRVNGSGMVMAGKGLKEAPGQHEWTVDLVRVSLMNNDIQHIGDEICPKCPKLSVLTLHNNDDLVGISYSLGISYSFFVHMESLKFLDLSCTFITELPDSISDLCNLNALWLSSCVGLQFLPSVAKLKKLRELDLADCPSLWELPQGMKELVNLRHLDIRESSILSIEDGILSNLQKLESFWSSCEITTEMIGELSKLTHLSGLAGRIADIEGFEKCNFERWQDYDLKVGPHDGDESYYFNRWMGGIEYSSLEHNLKGLHFNDCNFGASCLLDALPFISDVASLESCSLERCSGIEYIISDRWIKRRGRDVASKPLEKLQTLDLLELDNFVGLVKDDLVRPYIFHSLRELTVSECPKMKKLVFLNQELCFLQEISIYVVEEMEEALAIADEAGEGAIRLPNLKKLILSNLPELRSMCKSVVFFPKLEWLDVWKCPKMKKLALLENQELCSLQNISINSSEEMEELFAIVDEAGEGAIRLPSLEELGLWNLSKLRSICKNDVFFPKLKRLKVSRCQKMEKVVLLKNQELRSLQEIHIYDSQEMEELFAIADEAEEGAIRLPSLEELKLCNLPEFKSICKNDVFFPKLKRLNISGCQKMKKVVLLKNQELRSLEIIDIRDCEQMEEILEMKDEVENDAIQLPNLKKLILRNLPELRSICKKTIVCNSLEEMRLEGSSGEKLENCPISVPMLSVNNNHPHPLLVAEGKHRDWWNELLWNDPATQDVFNTLKCLTVEWNFSSSRDRDFFSPFF